MITNQFSDDSLLSNHLFQGYAERAIHWLQILLTASREVIKDNKTNFCFIRAEKKPTWLTQFQGGDEVINKHFADDSLLSIQHIQGYVEKSMSNFFMLLQWWSLVMTKLVFG